MRQELPIVHGTTTAYRKGCRDVCCQGVVRRYEKLRELRKLRGEPAGYVPALGTVRRLLALGAVGYSQHELARETGILQRHLWSIINAEHGATTVFASTEARVAAAFDRLAAAGSYPLDRKGAARSGPVRAARAAVARGGVPPLWWDDDLIDLPGPIGRPADPGLPAPTRRGGRPDFDAAGIADRLACGWELNRIADEYGVQPKSIHEMLLKRGLNKLAAQALASWYRPQDEVAS